LHQSQSPASIEADQTEEPSADTTAAQPDEENMHAEQGNTAGVVSSAFISRNHMAEALLLDTPDGSDYEGEDREDWEHGFAMELDHRLQSLVGAF
jgi:hypothetical protein